MTLSVLDRGPWQQTFSGKRFFPLDPRFEDVDVLDIAHALAHQCRFAGACRQFYSVAEHCVRASAHIEPAEDELRSLASAGYAKSLLDARNVLALAALLHDAHEAYVVDVPRPLKQALRTATPTRRSYDQIEVSVQRVVCDRLGVPWSAVISLSVKRADEVMLMTEARDLMAPPPEPWTFAVDDVEPLPYAIEPWSPEDAKARWLARFRELGGRP